MSAIFRRQNFMFIQELYLCVLSSKVLSSSTICTIPYILYNTVYIYFIHNTVRVNRFHVCFSSQKLMQLKRLHFASWTDQKKSARLQYHGSCRCVPSSKISGRQLLANKGSVQSLYLNPLDIQRDQGHQKQDCYSRPPLPPPQIINPYEFQIQMKIPPRPRPSTRTPMWSTLGRRESLSEPNWRWISALERILKIFKNITKLKQNG